MATIGFIIWYVTIFGCLSVLFISPKLISKRINEYRFPNYSRIFVDEDNKFIREHVQLIDNYRVANKDQPKAFIIKSGGMFLLFIILEAVMMAILLWGGKYLVWLLDLIGNRSTESSYLVLPFGGTLTLAVGLFFGLFIVVPALQLWAVRNNKEQAAAFLLLPASYHDKKTPEEIEKGTAEHLTVLIREGRLDSRKSYTIDELIEINIFNTHRRNIELVLAAIIIFFSMFTMSAFEFVKISNKQIVYSPSYSFKVTTQNFEQVTSAKYICVTEDNERYLKLLVELDNGYKFRVRRFEIENMDAILKASNISLSDTDAAYETCKSKK